MACSPNVPILLVATPADSQMVFEEGRGGTMSIKRKPFVSQKLEEEREQEKSKVITVRLNLEELSLLEEDGRLLRQEKIGTALKQGWLIGRTVLHSPEIAAIIDTVFNNERKNKRIGIEIPNPEFMQK